MSDIITGMVPELSPCIVTRMQSAGLGGLKHNTIMIGWPYGWRHETEKQPWKSFVSAVCQAEAANCALTVLKGVQLFPSNADKLIGTIDIWWIVRILLIQSVEPN